MPLEILVQLKDGTSELHYIPISLMRGEKENNYTMEWTIQPDWKYAHVDYRLVLNHPKDNIEFIIIDPSNLMADIDKENNYYAAEE